MLTILKKNATYKLYVCMKKVHISQASLYSHIHTYIHTYIHNVTYNHMLTVLKYCDIQIVCMYGKKCIHPRQVYTLTYIHTYIHNITYTHMLTIL